MQSGAKRGDISVSRFKSAGLIILLLASAGYLQAETVTLQLKWYHQFQFAGYYAAIEKGYYRAAGLDVRLIEATKGSDPIADVINGKSDYGVGTSDLILLRSQGKPVVVLGVIFQHSPLVLLTRGDGEIQSLHDLQGKPVMIEPGSAELFAYLKSEGVPVHQLDLHTHTLDTSGLIDGKLFAMSAYSTDEPYELQKRGIPYQVFSPRSAGIDFYGDNLFTTEKKVKENPKQVRAFVNASLAGWNYAMDHPQEMVNLIAQKYSKRKSVEHLLFEAQQTRRLVFAELIEIGYMNPGRWQHIMQTYVGLGMLKKEIPLDGFLYNRNPRQNLKWLYITVAAALLLALVVSGVLARYYRLNHTLQRQIEERKYLMNELRRIASIDTVTGIHNRRSFLEMAKLEEQRTKRHRRPLSVLIFDIDHFKQINDTHGHAIGDEALKQCSDACLKVLRQTDVMGRIGGEEFAAFLPETDLQGAIATAERLRTAIQDLRIKSKTSEFGMTISIGLAVIGTGETFDAALARADRCLYQAKERGRNQYVASTVNAEG